MVQYGKELCIYVQKEVIDRIDQLVMEDKELWRSRSQAINSILYRFLREKGKIPAETTQIYRK